MDRRTSVCVSAIDRERERKYLCMCSDFTFHLSFIHEQSFYFLILLLVSSCSLSPILLLWQLTLPCPPLCHHLWWLSFSLPLLAPPLLLFSSLQWTRCPVSLTRCLFFHFSIPKFPRGNMLSPPIIPCCTLWAGKPAQIRYQGTSSTWMLQDVHLCTCVFSILVTCNDWQRDSYNRRKSWEARRVRCGPWKVQQSWINFCSYFLFGKTCSSLSVWYCKQVTILNLLTPFP